MTNLGLRIDGRLVAGVVILAVGILFTLDKLGLVNAGVAWRYWPVLLMAIGLAKLLGVGTGAQRGLGALLLLVGTWFLLDRLDVVDVGFWEMWPLLLVVFGGYLVIRAIAGPRRAADADSSSRMSAFALMAGVGRKNASPEFRGGDATAIMGGCEIDLRGAAMPPEGEAVLDTFAFWGGIEVRVPEDWRVSSEVVPLLGGFEDSTKPPAAPKGHLRVKGLAVMGGVEVKN